jgi:hypothetical protein
MIWHISSGFYAWESSEVVGVLENEVCVRVPVALDLLDVIYLLELFLYFRVGCDGKCAAGLFQHSHGVFVGVRCSAP